MEFRIGGKISGFVLSLLLVLIIAVSAMQYMTTYDAMSSLVDKVAREQKMAPQDFNESDFPAVKQDLLDNCSARGDGLTTVSLEDNKTATLNCTNVQELKDSKDLFALLAVSGFNDMYFKKYDCNFINCFSQAKTLPDKMGLLVSEKAHNFYKSSYWYVVVATVIVGMLYVFFTGDLFKSARGLGWSFAIIGSGFIFSLIFKDTSIPLGSGNNTVSVPVIANILSVIQTYFIVYFIIGIVLLAIGYGGNFLKPKQSKDTQNKKKKS
jgi:hypothetical protein